MPRIVVEKGPGPAEYTPSDIKSTTAPAYTIAGRPDTSSSDAALASNPGPGTYTPANAGLYNAPAHTILGKGKSTSYGSASPGPGRYAPPVLGHTAPAYSIGGSSRASGSGARLDRVPGPGSYTPGADMRKQSPPAYSIPGRGDGKADTSATARLGPGSYTPTVDAYKHKASAFSMGRPSSAPPRRADPSPGPGSYSATAATEHRSAAYSMGTPSKKVSSRQGSDPGPGSYSPSLNAYKHTASAFSMGKPSVRKGDKISRTPGPGNYDAGMPTRYRSPAFSIVGRPGVARAATATPGPQHYSPSKANLYRAAGYSMGKDRRKDSAMPRTPAPGQYDAADYKTRSPAWVIKPSMSSRSMAKADNNPGPGSYFTGSGQVGEAYSEITRFGGEMLTKASKTWAHRNPGNQTAIRFNPVEGGY